MRDINPERKKKEPFRQKMWKDIHLYNSICTINSNLYSYYQNGL